MLAKASFIPPINRPVNKLVVGY